MKPWVTKYEHSESGETVFAFNVPASYMDDDWRFRMLMEFSLMMAKPEDFIKV